MTKRKSWTAIVRFETERELVHEENRDERQSQLVNPLPSNLPAKLVQVSAPWRIGATMQSGIVLQGYRRIHNCSA